jgi:uncharacterized spore protein YtfJ
MAAQTNWEMDYRRMNSSVSSSTSHIMAAGASASDKGSGVQPPLRDVSKRGLLGGGSRHYKSSSGGSSGSGGDVNMIPVASAVVVDREVKMLICMYTRCSICIHISIDLT